MCCITIIHFLQVNANGDISFLGGFSTFYPGLFPSSNPLIAPFWADSDTSPADGGDVWYRETNDLNLLERAKNTIRAACIDHITFEPVSLFIATWDHVGHYPQITTVVRLLLLTFIHDKLKSDFIYFKDMRRVGRLVHGRSYILWYRR